jgi:threonine dehydrogenase-like Zn-dependent dehydrogenase
MPGWLAQLLGAIYAFIPSGAKPYFKAAFWWGQIRLVGLFTRRRVVAGRRVEFLTFEIAHLERFEFLSPGRKEVEVDVFASTVSPGTERAVLCGLPGSRRGFPYIPGYSSAGLVTRGGAGTDGFPVGSRVAGRIKHASADSVNVDLLFRVPDGVSHEAASFIELGVITLQGIRKARIKPGDRVAVVGQGLIGQLANRLVRALGVPTVIALAPSRNRAATALAAGGAHEFIEMRDAFDASRVAADIVIEAVGTPDAVVTAMNCARDGGRVVLLGSSRGLSRDLDLGALAQARDLEIVGAHISDLPAADTSPGRFTYRQEGALFLELLRTGRLVVDDLVTWRAAPEECNAVYEALAKGGRQHVAIVFQWHPEGAVQRVGAGSQPSRANAG